MTVEREAEVVSAIKKIMSDGGWSFPQGHPWIVYVEDCDDECRPIANTPNVFNDKRLVIEGDKIVTMHEATTMYGLPGGRRPTRRDGPARISLGFHQDVWALGFHKGRSNHPALVQAKPTYYTRDLNGDYERVGDKQYIGKIGLNQHSVVGRPPVLVGGNSLGCMTGRFMSSHKTFISLLRNCEYFKKNGPRALFSSLIIKSSDL